MKIWYFYFMGMYPVGACGIVSAETEALALTLAKDTVRHEGFNPDSVKAVIEFKADLPSAHIILNGDY